MFQYNPGVYDQGGQILADSATRTAAIQAQMMSDFGKNVSSGMKKAASAVAGFAMGGPAGAAMAAQGAGGGGGGEGADSVIGAFVQAYGNNKALEAKGKAYGDFMSKHGEQLGFNPEYLKDFAARDPREQAMIGDNIIGMQNAGSWVSRNQYLNQQANLYGRGTGTGTGGGGGGAQPFTRVP